MSLLPDYIRSGTSMPRRPRPRWRVRAVVAQRARRVSRVTPSDFSTGHARVLVATDVAARGIHVDDVDLVVHFDPPADHKDYLHRSGRTARAGERGTVLSLLLSGEVRYNQRLRERAGVEVSAQTVVPGHPAVRALAESGEAVVVTYVPRPESPRRSPSYGPRSGRPNGSRPARVSAHRAG